MRLVIGFLETGIFRLQAVMASRQISAEPSSVDDDEYDDDEEGDLSPSGSLFHTLPYTCLL
jgi:hypothetical protein